MHPYILFSKQQSFYENVCRDASCHICIYVTSGPSLLIEWLLSFSSLSYGNNPSLLSLSYPAILLTHLDYWSDKLLHKVMLEKIGPVVVDEVDDKALDVGAILILVGHHHQLPIAKGLQLTRVGIFLIVLESKYLHHIANFLIPHDLNNTATKIKISNGCKNGILKNPQNLIFLLLT